MLRSFNGKTPVVHPRAFVSEMAYVVGDVEVHEGASVWPGAVIRGDNSRIVVGRDTSIQDNAVVHSDDIPLIIGEGCTIGHCVVVHCIRIGNNCLIGNNCTLLGNAEIGNFCIVGANAMVREGMKIPDYSFVVGVPARVKGRLSDEQLKSLSNGGLHYVQRGQAFREAGL